MVIIECELLSRIGRCTGTMSSAQCGWVRNLRVAAEQ